MGLREPPKGDVYPTVQLPFPKLVGTHFNIDVQTVVRELKEQGIEDILIRAYFVTDDVICLGVYGYANN